MADKFCDVICCLKLLIIICKFSLELSCFICICILVNRSSKNPFENHVIGNLSNYFYGEDISTTEITNHSKSNNSIISQVNITKNILKEGKDISSVENFERKIILRKLVADSFCSQIHDNFEKYKNRLLSNIFDLNYGKIKGICIAILVVFCMHNLVTILFYIFIKEIGSVLYVLIILLYIARFILSLILYYFMEKGDIQKYDDFLDCKKVKVKVFKKFSDVHIIKNCFFTFVIMNIINQGIEKIEKIIEEQLTIQKNLLNSPKTSLSS